MAQLKTRGNRSRWGPVKEQCNPVLMLPRWGTEISGSGEVPMGTTVTRSGEAMLRIRVTSYRLGPGRARVTWYREAKVMAELQGSGQSQWEQSNHVPMMPR